MPKISGVLSDRVLRRLIRETAMSITSRTPTTEKNQKLAWIMDLRKELQLAAAINQKRLQEKVKRAEKSKEQQNA